MPAPSRGGTARFLRNHGLKVDERYPHFHEGWPTVTDGDDADQAMDNTFEKVAVVDLAAASGAGNVFAWQNPEAVPIIVRDVALDVTTAATGAATVDVGTAADGTTSSNNLLDGQDVNAATGVFSSTTKQRMDEKGGSTDYITASQASGDVTGLAGKAYITYVKTRS